MREHRDGNTGTFGGVEGVTRFRYNTAGDLIRREDPSGLVTVWTYDGLGRVSTRSETADSVTTMVYEVTARYADGAVMTERGPSVQNPVSLVSHRSQTVYGYDGNGNVTSMVESDVAGSDAPRQTTTVFDALDRPVSVKDPEGHAGSTSVGTH